MSELSSLYHRDDEEPKPLEQRLQEFVAYCQRKGHLPPSGSSPEDQRRRDEWRRTHLDPCRKANR